MHYHQFQSVWAEWVDTCPRRPHDNHVHSATSRPILGDEMFIWSSVGGSLGLLVYLQLQLHRLSLFAILVRDLHDKDNVLLITERACFLHFKSAKWRKRFRVRLAWYQRVLNRFQKNLLCQIFLINRIRPKPDFCVEGVEITPLTFKFYTPLPNMFYFYQ